ncbi:membrane-bound serine protease (ClpP class) [Chitinophaga niastensis]|uniref:Membrane-bound serine protease (ClpP class) n=1 Tax=Chitinophaga niastensis TaxID=536980 RepID=A0A2P8HC84_CHINA|nr:nodulation protein NfeD [Chitinophaga niastensis]PSL43853.1 membrane-bound serine protease (ClpP class) [Chitinophaga niastensis]
MNQRAFFSVLLFFLPSLLAAQTVISLKIDGNINPVTAEFIHRGIESACHQKAECLVIELNTPGGLLKSTRVIVSDMLESPMPIVVFVAPGGAHAGSAGVFITLAANIAAMAPGTNIGAAHPVSLQGESDSIMNGKVTNDAAAFIRTIAEKRKRNAEWAEEAVRKSLSITANEALEKKVINLVAVNMQELLNRIDGQTVETATGTITLHTRNAHITSLEMGTEEKILDVLSDPNFAYILLLLGLYGMLFELYNPGAILPGIVGVISLILAFYSLHTLPVNFAGLALIIFGIILFLLEIKIVSHGLLTIGGIVALFLGSLMLIRADPTSPDIKISRTIIISATLVSTLFFLFILGFGLKAQRLKPVSGIDGLVGKTGESLEVLNPNGTIRVHGETWNATSISGKIEKGEKVQVVGIVGLQLRVEHIH